MRTLALLFLAAFLTACTSTGGTAIVEHPDTPHERYEFSQIHMGVRANIIIYSDDEQAAIAAARAGFAEIARIDSIMSDYRVDSELNRFSDAAGHGWVPVSKDLYDVLETAQYISIATHGAFDVTVGPCSRLWREMRKTKTHPPRAVLEQAHQLVDYTRLHLDEQTQSAKLDTPGMRLDLGGIAKGYALDSASRVLVEHDCPDHLVALAGDIVVGFGPPDRNGWRIAVDPRAVSDATDEPTDRPTVIVQNNGISTSGDVNQFVEIDGRRYSHIVDPRTGLGSPRQVSATVVGPLGSLADPLATALTLLTPQQAVQVVDALGQIAARIEWIDDSGRDQVITTALWSTVANPGQNAERGVAPSEATPHPESVP